VGWPPDFFKPKRIVPQPAEWQGVTDEIDAAMIFAGADFVNVHFATLYHFLIAVWRAKQAECGA
jgi:hypothetical protein